MGMSNVKLRLYQAWFHQYLGRGRDYGPRGVNAAMSDALDAGLSEAEIHRVMDLACDAFAGLPNDKKLQMDETRFAKFVAGEYVS